MLYKTIIIPVVCNHADTHYLNRLNSESAKVWNRCVELDKEAMEDTGKQISWQQMQTRLLGFSDLHRMGVYHVYRKYLFARDAMWKSRKAKHKNSYLAMLPYKNKKYFKRRIARGC